MTISIRTAGPGDIGAVSALLARDARERARVDPVLWALKPDPEQTIGAALQAAMSAEAPPFRQRWLVAEEGGAVTGVVHDILLPVPPIYAGAFGPPGLIMEDSFVAEDAPEGTREALFAAAERDLREAGAQVLLASSVPGAAWEEVQEAAGYVSLTLYLSRAGVRGAAAAPTGREAGEDDLAGIVARSAEHRAILHGLEDFWRPHPEADARFGAWMRKSLTLADRDMFVDATEAGIAGYVIAQPATPLHFPHAHAIGATGFIDDFHHLALSDPGRGATAGTVAAGAAADGGGAAAGLVARAEAALQARGKEAVLVVCPAEWHSKRALLEAMGYAPALAWRIRR